MVTIQEARQILERHFAEHPPAISGDLYIATEWYEDEQDFLPVWGSRQFLIDGGRGVRAMGQSGYLHRQAIRRRA